MKLGTFESEVIRLAYNGVRLTVANVAARLSLPTDKAEQWLDELTKRGKLDLDIDERQGLIVYTVRGLIPRRNPRYGASPATELRIAELEAGIERAPHRPAQMLHPGIVAPKKKSVVIAFLAGAFLPGLGLFYVAPIASAVVASIVCLLLMKLAVIPFIGPVIGGGVALGSGLIGVLYANAFNRTGRRTEIVDRLTGRKQLPSR